MRAGILIMGSLLWNNNHREEWRQQHLCLDNKVHVKAPICYGRRAGSWGNSYTMTFSQDRRLGQAVIVPCRRDIYDSSAFIDEAVALWKAEYPRATEGSVGASWGGCVGALFRDYNTFPETISSWNNYFGRKSTSPISPVNENGLLEIPWPTVIESDSEINVDVILATATKAEEKVPKPEDIADAWVKQNNGYERYFFENVRHGIRTPDDMNIWMRIEEYNPQWLDNDEYVNAIEILRAEME